MRVSNIGGFNRIVEKSTKNTLNNISELVRREITKSPAQWWRNTLRQKDMQKFVKETRHRFEIEVGHPEELTDEDLEGLRDWIDRHIIWYVKRVYDIDLPDFEEINTEVQWVYDEIIDGFEHYIVTGKYPHTLPDGINGGVRIVPFELATGETVEMVQTISGATTDIEALIVDLRATHQELFGVAKRGAKQHSPIGLWFEGLPDEEQNQPNPELARQYLQENPSETRNGIAIRAEIRRYSERLRKFRKSKSLLPSTDI